MDEQGVRNLADAFIDRWNPYLKVNPIVELDYTWPSVGVVDLFTFSFRLKRELAPVLDEMLTGACAYLSVMAKTCWSQFAADVELGANENGIFIAARGGDFISEGAEAAFPIEHEFRRILIEVPFPFPVFNGVERQITFESNIVSLFALGLMTGLAPGTAGAWRGITPEEFEKPIERVVKELARQSAENYSRVFPKEPLGQMAELYLNELISPPLMIGEELPGTGKMERLLSYFDHYGFRKEMVMQLAHNLALSPDDTFSSMGLALYGALCSDTPPAKVQAAAQAKGKFMGLLRPAMMIARAHFGDTRDWLTSGISTEEDEMRFQIEHDMRFLPWLCLSAERLRSEENKQRLVPLLTAMRDFDLDAAIRSLDQLVDEDPSDIELRTQRIKLEMARGDHDRALELIKSLATEPDSDKFPHFLNLAGMCRMQLQDFEGAQRDFGAALNLGTLDDAFRAEVENNYAWISVLLREPDVALGHIELGLNMSDCPVTLLLNQQSVLWTIGRYEQIPDIKRRLFRLAPCDRRVFANLTLDDTLIEAIKRRG